jgi:hypothetical protein
MDKPTIATLFAEAGKQLRDDFEHVRSTMPHAGLKGEEVEGILRTFLDRHLPQRFRAGSGLIIDSENNLSKQMDIIVYDALSSPLYRFSERAQIIPADSVASAIQVKTALNKRELEDAYENIASSKRLKKRPLSDIDRKSTGSEFSTLATFGVVFGFDADASLEVLAKNAAEVNAKYDSNLWPDLIVVLDQGAISYSISFPGETEMAALLQPPGDDEFLIPPAYVHLFILHEKEFTLNRFFLMLLSHLTFYPYRASTPPFDVMMKGSPGTGMNFTAYQFNRARRLRPVPEDEYMDKRTRPPLSIYIFSQDGRQLGVLQFLPWQDGSVVRMIGQLSLKTLLADLLREADKNAIVIARPGDSEVSSVLSVTEEEFRKWPDRISTVFGLVARLS